MAKNKTAHELLNENAQILMENRLRLIALNRFEWEGLPEGLEGRHIENALYRNGKAMFFKSPRYGLLCLPCNEEGGQNVYGDFLQYRAIGFNYEQNVGIDEGALIRNNKTCTPTKHYIELYATRIVECERTMDINVQAQKTPYFITGDDRNMLTLKNILRKVSTNEPAIFADKNFNMESIQIFETVAPFVCDKLQDHKTNLLNDFLTMMGINNHNSDKKERLLTDEVNANNGYIFENVDVMLEQREKACEDINKKFGLNVSVRLKNEIEVEEGEEGEDESVHTND